MERRSNYYEEQQVPDNKAKFLADEFFDTSSRGEYLVFNGQDDEDNALFGKIWNCLYGRAARKGLKGVFGKKKSPDGKLFIVRKR